MDPVTSIRITDAPMFGPPDRPWVVVDVDADQVLGLHATESQAQAHLAELIDDEDAPGFT